MFCDHKILKKKMPVKSLDGDLLTKIFSEIKKELKGKKMYELGLVGLGEPLLDKNLKSHLKIIDEYAHLFERISINSNLVALTKKKVILLIESPINVFTFSVNASDRKTYLEMMGKDKFDKIVINLKTFLHLFKKKGREAKIGVQIIDSKKNHLRQLKSLLPESEKLGVDFFIRDVYNKPVLYKSNGLVNIHNPKKKKRYPCWDIYTRLYVDVEGYYYVCAIGNDSYRERSSLCLGNVRDNSVFELFNGKHMQLAREMSEKGKVPFSECKTCVCWSLNPNNFTWSSKKLRWIKKKDPIRGYGL
tara:strand:+ start:6541 stop:7449 length:909 start_codon:yes stop_codon:yes gene_type:complete